MFAFHRRCARAFFAAVTLNALTHPALHIFFYFLLASRTPLFYPLLAAEFLVIPVEALLLSRLFNGPIKSYIFLSAVMNLASFSFGEVLLFY